MALLKAFNKKAKAENETGLGTNSGSNGGRFFNKDGTPNQEMRGVPFLERFNLYHALLSLPTWKFLFITCLSFVAINLIFAGIYLVIGISHLNGMVASNGAEKFGEAFFFSAQTFTTVGYGRINPVGFAASFVAALEALIGLMSFALITGLLYGRFARPKSYINYSKNALFVPFRGGVAFMIRMVPYTKNFLVNVEARMTLSMQVLEDGIQKNKFFNLALDISRANTLISNWTLVHIINEESPLYHLTKDDIDNAKAEILIFIQGFDESFSNTVISRSSYTYEEFVYGARFTQMYHPNPEKTGTILYINKLNDFELVQLPIKY
ncbi:ion channel [Parasediminibacterium sp. JCM 36343]|uniref:ion channel n=1 Tax=Parasediminibacterium sp. JCM 36343 TaxID=3374279 RepID=UPI003978E4F2